MVAAVYNEQWLRICQSLDSTNLGAARAMGESARVSSDVMHVPCSGTIDQ